MRGPYRENFLEFIIERPMFAVQDLSAKLAAKLRLLPRSKVAIEPEEIPAALLDALRSDCPQLEFCSFKDVLSTLRMVKDAENSKPCAQRWPCATSASV